MKEKEVDQKLSSMRWSIAIVFLCVSSSLVYLVMGYNTLALLCAGFTFLAAIELAYTLARVIRDVYVIQERVGASSRRPTRPLPRARIKSRW